MPQDSARSLWTSCEYVTDWLGIDQNPYESPSVESFSPSTFFLACRCSYE